MRWLRWLIPGISISIVGLNLALILSGYGSPSTPGTQSATATTTIPVSAGSAR
jgi:hypothetical protein